MVTMVPGVGLPSAAKLIGERERATNPATAKMDRATRCSIGNLLGSIMRSAADRCSGTAVYFSLYSVAIHRLSRPTRKTIHRGRMSPRMHERKAREGQR